MGRTESSSQPIPTVWSPADVNLESQFRQEHPVAWWSTLIGPFLLTVIILVILWQVNGASFVWRLLTTAFVTFFFFGKLVILGGTAGEVKSISAFLTTEELFAMVVYMDLLTACVLAFHLGFVLTLPVIGRKLEALMQDGHFILQSHPWMRRATFVGLVAFVVFPLAATGSLGGSIFGRLLGLSRVATLLGISLGSILGCAITYFGAEFINKHFDRNNPWLVVSGIALIVAMILLLNYRYRHMKAKYYAAHPRQH